MCCKVVHRVVYKAVYHLNVTSWKPFAKIMQCTTDNFSFFIRDAGNLHICNVVVLIFRKEVTEPTADS